LRGGKSHDRLLNRLGWTMTLGGIAALFVGSIGLSTTRGAFDQGLTSQGLLWSFLYIVLAYGGLGLLMLGASSLVFAKIGKKIEEEDEDEEEEEPSSPMSEEIEEQIA